ncbi:hypothetical protein GQ53DRAFT_741194 [Thozetella sp. PMI_491]|nr:hypothetical protein GQ53DRAFT_741194 [Thozetella sp. PMI_491]
MSSPAAPARALPSFVRTANIISAKQTIPFAYRAILVTIEPLFALGGAFLAMRKPASYLATMTREAGVFRPETAFLYTQLGGGFLYFAFIELVILHSFDDRRLWRMLCLGMLLSDFAHIFSTPQAVGGWISYASVSDWSMNDWVVVATTLPPVVVRLLIVFGVGMELPRAPAQSAKKSD